MTKCIQAMVPPCRAPAVLSEGKLSQSCSGDCLENLATFWTFRHSWDRTGSSEDLVLRCDLGKSEAEGAQPLPVAGEETEACGLIPGHWWVRTKRQPGLGLLARKSCCPKSPLRLPSQPFLPALPPNRTKPSSEGTVTRPPAPGCHLAAA